MCFFSYTRQCIMHNFIKFKVLVLFHTWWFILRLKHEWVDAKLVARLKAHYTLRKKFMDISDRDNNAIWGSGVSFMSATNYTCRTNLAEVQTTFMLMVCCQNKTLISTDCPVHIDFVDSARIITNFRTNCNLRDIGITGLMCCQTVPIQNLYHWLKVTDADNPQNVIRQYSSLVIWNGQHFSSSTLILMLDNVELIP